MNSPFYYWLIVPRTIVPPPPPAAKTIETENGLFDVETEDGKDIETE